MYGNTHGQPIREDLPYQAHTKKGKVRGEMANMVMEAHRAGKVHAAIARGSNFFGPDDHGMTDLAFRPALRRQSSETFLDEPTNSTLFRTRLISENCWQPSARAKMRWDRSGSRPARRPSHKMNSSRSWKRNLVIA